MPDEEAPCQFERWRRAPLVVAMVRRYSTYVGKVSRLLIRIYMYILVGLNSPETGPQLVDMRRWQVTRAKRAGMQPSPWGKLTGNATDAFPYQRW